MAQANDFCVIDCNHVSLVQHQSVNFWAAGDLCFLDYFHRECPNAIVHDWMPLGDYEAVWEGTEVVETVD